ncbi:hypothetical protein Tco_0426832, partial [Tanacetum coccineum]
MTKRDEEIAGLAQQVQALQAAVQQRDTQIQQLQTTVTEMSSRESTLMQCILGMDRRLVDLERRPRDLSSLVSSLFLDLVMPTYIATKLLVPVSEVMLP